MRNLKFVRYSAVLLGLVVLCTKARNRFCPMCTKECCIVLTRPTPFWGQFWGQNGKADSHTHRSNKCAALVSLRNADTYIAGFSHRKSPTNRYISFTLQQEVVRKHYSTQSPHTASVAASGVPSRQIPPQSPRFPGIFILPQRRLPRLDFPVQVNPTQINN